MKNCLVSAFHSVQNLSAPFSTSRLGIWSLCVYVWVCVCACVCACVCVHGGVYVSSKLSEKLLMTVGLEGRQ